MSETTESPYESPYATAPGPAVGELLEKAAARAVPVVRGLPDALLADPTPCSEYDVKTLVNHLFHVVVQFRGLAERKNSEFGEAPDYVGQDADWRERFAEATGHLVAAWSVPGVEDGTTGAMNMPARTVGCMVLLDLTVHIWDLSRATGEDFAPDEAATEVLWTLSGAVAELAPTARKMGVFAEPVAVPEDASGFDRLLAATGRDPGWTRAGAESADGSEGAGPTG